MAEQILPGTYITVRDEGLISAGRVASGYVGVVGTASKGPVDEVVPLSSFSDARALFGEAEPDLTLVRSLELVFNNGGSSVFAVRAAAADPDDEAQSLAQPASLALPGSPAVMTLSARTPGTWGNDLSVTVSTVEDSETGRVLELRQGAMRELFLGVNTQELARAVNTTSRLAVAVPTQGAATSRPAALTTTKLVNGANGEQATSEDYKRALARLENEIVNVVVLAGQDTGMLEALQGHLNRTAQIQRERIGIIGARGSDVAGIAADSDAVSSDRLLLVAPGIRTRVVDPRTRTESEVSLSTGYTAAAVAGLLSSLPVQASPTNKPLAIGGLSRVFNSAELEKLVQKNVLVVEKREGYRVVKGVTTASNSAWRQITTRRIVDYALYGVRSACNPYIGKLNNDRVRGALKATVDGFLTRMVQDEALTGYTLEVSATRPQEVMGECSVTLTLQPTFSIDYIMVTMYLK